MLARSAEGGVGQNIVGGRCHPIAESGRLRGACKAQPSHRPSAHRQGRGRLGAHSATRRRCRPTPPPAAGPVSQIYFSSQFAPLIIFFLMFLSIVKNKKLHHFVRFNCMQASGSAARRGSTAGGCQRAAQGRGDAAAAAQTRRR